jgi:hypothetical protein
VEGLLVTTALALPSLLPGRLHENGMEIPPDLDFETWESVLRNAEWIERASPWWVVDLVAYGRDKFHEDYSQALPDAVEDVDGFHRAKLAQAEWMADRWPPSTRVLGQSYSAHRAVAKLDRADAVALLHETDKDGRRLPVRVLARRADEIEESIRGQAIQVDGTPVDTESATSGGPSTCWSGPMSATVSWSGRHDRCHPACRHPGVLAAPDVRRTLVDPGGQTDAPDVPERAGGAAGVPGEHLDHCADRRAVWRGGGATMRVLSLGAGVQSSTLLLMAVHGEVQIDRAIFADTGWEPRGVYDWLGGLQLAAGHAGIPVDIVSAGNLREDAISRGAAV